MLVLKEGLDLDLVYESLYQFRADLRKGYLLDRSHELSGIVLCAIDVAKPTLSQYLPQFELLEEGELFLFVEDFGTFGFLDVDVAVGRSQWLEGVFTVLDVSVYLEGRDLYVVLRVVVSDHRPFRLVFLVILGRDGDVLDDGNVEPSLALGVLMQLDLS